VSYEFHTEILRNIAREMRPAVYVELGVFMGDTLNAVLPYVEGKAYACDIYDKFVPNVLPQFKYRLQDFSLTTTDTLAEKWTNEIKADIDLIFIDADHSKESVYKDIMNFWPFLKEDRGLMVLHDMWPPSVRYVDPGYCGDGFLVKNKIKRELPDLEFVSLPLQYGLGIMRKVGKDWRNGDMGR
jgi:predicted O-methyltransferase YrrM